LKHRLGTHIDIHQSSRGRGRIVIHFSNRDEFERLHSLLENSDGVAARVA
jgi:ParB family chromosome partitioning protein